MLGAIVSHYKILEKLGEGGMGVVYRAEDTKLKRTVALKFLPRGLESNEPERARLLQEAQAASALNHPNVCTIYDIAEHDAQQFIVMEYVDGHSLREIIQRAIPTLQSTISYAIQIGEALQEAHAHGIVHRDIKTDNIMLNSQNRIKVMDFGLAKLKGSLKLTKTSSTVGTLAYMAPEQIAGGEVDARSDVFSFGVLIYEMLTGHLPFRGEHEAAMVYSIVNEEPIPVQSYLSDISPEIVHILNRALEKDPEDRYQFVHEMVIDLRRLKKETTKVTHRSAEHVIESQKTFISRMPGKWKKKGMYVAGGALALTAVVALAWFIVQLVLGPPEPVPIAVISFENQTGDPAYDYLRDAIPNLLTTSLEQSKFLRVTTWERLRDLMRQMGKADVKLIDTDLGFDLCRRDSVRALVLGTFVKAGDVFATDVKVIDVETKKLLKSASSRGDGVASILKNQIDDLSRQISTGFGVPELSVATDQKPIREVTTTSIEAYNYYLRGIEEHQKLYYDNARRFLEKAVELDTMFATAHLALAFALGRLGEERLSRNSYEKAFAHIDKTSRRERLRIEAAYASVVDGDADKRIRILIQLIQEFPKEKSVHQSLGVHYSANTREYAKAINEFESVLALDPKFGLALSELGYTYLRLGNYPKALETFTKYASVAPGDANPIDDMGEAYYFMGHIDRAIEKFKEAYAVEPSWGSRWAVAHMYALKEDYSAARRYLDDYIAQRKSNSQKADGHMMAGFQAALVGNLDECNTQLDMATKLYESVGSALFIRTADWLKGWIYFDRGLLVSARKFNDGDWCEVWSKSQPQWSRFYQVYREALRGLIFLKEGKTDSSRACLRELSNVLSNSPGAYEPEMRSFHDVLKGEMLLAQDSAKSAIALWENAPDVPIPILQLGFTLPYNVPLQRDVLARAYARDGQIERAIAQYERLTRIDPDRKDRRFINPRYHHRLAKLYEQRGMKEKAISEYKKFLELWRNADRNLPELKEANVRLVALTH
jgi:tetratricopeptide (TPR) repeat protein/predicted Ser/Thr protein kinase